MPTDYEYARPFGPFTGLYMPTLPDFAVLCGENGSGKSTLLSAIANGKVRPRDSVDREVLSPVLLRTQLDATLELKYGIADARAQEQGLLAVMGSSGASGTGIGPFIENKHILGLVAKAAGRPVDELTESDIKAFGVSAGARAKSQPGSPLMGAVVSKSPPDPFSFNLAAYSMGFMRTMAAMHWANFVQNRGDASLAHIASYELPATPPWIVASAAIEPFGFKIAGPSMSYDTAERDLNLELQTIDGEPTSTSWLSGGERVMLALALALYQAPSGKLPKLMLLDESLSSLHPNLIRKAVDFLSTIFIENGTRVLMTTHSPTLVALAPEGSVFSVRREVCDLHVEEVTRDRAIGLLTHGVPTLRVAAENRRQVFVEAEVDEVVYTSLSSQLSEDLDPEVGLTFIRVGKNPSKDASGSTAVLHFVEKLREGGNTTIRGLVDWDGDDAERPREVHVAFKGERYAIENALLDPAVILGALTLHASTRGHVEGLTLSTVMKLDDEKLQQRVDKLVETIRSVAEATSRATFCSTDRREVTYLGGRRLQIPVWALETRGHDYADYVLAAYPQLRHIRGIETSRSADKLITGIAMHYANVLRDLFPTSIVREMRSLAAMT